MDILSEIFLPLGADTTGAMAYTYDFRFVAASYLVAAFASYVAFHLVARLALAETLATRVFWLGTGALSMGSGIWSMHFIAMQAIEMPLEAQYGLVLTALSVVFAVCGSCYAFFVVTHEDNAMRRLLLGGLFMGSAIGAMHYTGMAAMQMPATIGYDPLIFALSVLVAVGLSALALRLMSDWSGSASGQRRLPRIVGAGVMGLSITTMHYTGMAATYFFPAPAPPVAGNGLDTSVMVAAISGAALLITGLALLAAFVDARLHMSLLKRRHSESLLESVVRTAPDAIAVFDGDYALRTLNPAGVRLFGHAARDIIGQDVSLLFPEMKAQAGDPRHTTDVGGAFMRIDVIETCGRCANGDLVPMEVNFSSILVDGQRMITLIARDITERKRREDEQRRLEEQLNQSRKMEALGTLAGGVAHDINNALVPILGLASFAGEALSEDNVAKEYLERIAQSAERIQDLTQRILAFSRSESGIGEGASEVDVPATIQDAVAFVRPTLPATLSIELDIDAATGSVRAGTTQMHQIVINLLNNAAQAMNHRPGHVLIRVERMTLDDQATGLLALPAGNYAHLRVADDGPGMAPSVLERIFDPFFTTKGVGEGTGLGLSVVHGIIASLGSTIRATSDTGRGAQFDIYLPLCGPAPAAVSENRAEQQCPAPPARQAS